MDEERNKNKLTSHGQRKRRRSPIHSNWKSASFMETLKQEVVSKEEVINQDVNSSNNSGFLSSDDLLRRVTNGIINSNAITSFITTTDNTSSSKRRRVTNEGLEAAEAKKASGSSCSNCSGDSGGILNIKCWKKVRFATAAAVAAALIPSAGVSCAIVPDEEEEAAAAAGVEIIGVTTNSNDNLCWYTRAEYSDFQLNIKRDVYHMATMHKQNQAHLINRNEYCSLGLEKYCSSTTTQLKIKTMRQQRIQGVLGQQAIQKQQRQLNNSRQEYDPEPIRIVAETFSAEAVAQGIARADRQSLKQKQQLRYQQRQRQRQQQQQQQQQRQTSHQLPCCVSPLCRGSER